MLCHIQQQGTKYTVSTFLAVIHLPTFVRVPCLRLINFQKDVQIILVLHVSMCMQKITIKITMSFPLLMGI